jgi:hypothetical protein
MQFDTVAKRPKEVMLAGQITEDNGDFSLVNLPVAGDFTLKISFLGYIETSQKVSFGIKPPAGGPPSGIKPATGPPAGQGNWGGGMAGANFDRDRDGGSRHHDPGP